MRHKYAIRALVLGRFPARESGLVFTLLTEDLGLIRARAEGIRKPGAKLAAALQTFCESDVTLVRGKEGWRLTGALLVKNHFALLTREARLRLARVSGLLLRFVPADAGEPRLFPDLLDFIEVLPSLNSEEQDHAECVAALSLLVLLGLDPGDKELPLLSKGMVLNASERSQLIVRINRGIAASGL